MMYKYGEFQEHQIAEAKQIMRKQIFLSLRGKSLLQMIILVMRHIILIY